MNNVHDWLTTNRLTLNKKKSNFLIFRPRQKKMHFSPQISILDCETNQKISLEQKSYIKYLDVLINQNVSWKSHIDSVIVKISKTRGMIAKLVLQKRVLRLIYFTDRREDAIPLFAKAKILPVTFLYYEAVRKLMFDVHNQSAPINILKLFTKRSHIHTYNTRSSKSQFF